MTQRPNILFITDDQHRWDCVEMTGAWPVRTPNFARLATEGTWYRQTYSTCPLCMPARCSLINGLYGHQNSLTTNEGHWPLDVPTMPQALQRAGYRTAGIGKLHVFEGVPERLDLLTIEDQTRSLGFDYLHECGGKTLAQFCNCRYTEHLKSKGLLDRYLADIEAERGPNSQILPPSVLPLEDYFDVYIGDRCVEWLEQVETDRPFFLWAGLVSPHPSFDAPREYLEHYTMDEQPEPIDCEADRYTHYLSQRQHYCAMVEIVDAQIGRLLEVLERRGLLDNTLVLFTADHGEMVGDHGLAGKCHPYDPSTRVPTFARWPEHVPAGLASDALVEISDLTATCVEVGTGDSDLRRHLPRTFARSLTEHWQAASDMRDAPFREDVYSEDGGQFHPPFQMLRDATWKYTLFVDSGEETLFNMLEDPRELTNRAGDPECAEVRERLKTRLLARLASTLRVGRAPDRSGAGG